MTASRPDQARREGHTTTGRLLHRVSDVADQLSVSRSKVYELMASGALRSVKIDRTRLIRDVDLQKFVAALEAVPSD